MEHAARSRRAGPAQPRAGACVPRENRAGGRRAQRRYRPSSQNGVGPGGAVWLGAGVRQARGGLAHLCQGRVSSPFGPAGPSALRSQVPQAETNPSTFLAPRRVNRRWRGAPQSGRGAWPPRARRLRQRWPRRSAGLAPKSAAEEHAQCRAATGLTAAFSAGCSTNQASFIGLHSFPIGQALTHDVQLRLFAWVRLEA